MTTATLTREQLYREQSLATFVRLARAGKLRGASSSQINSRRIALAILDHIHPLDERTLDGLRVFLDAAKMQPETARGLIDGWD